MTKHKFKWASGVEHEFEDFTPIASHQGLYVQLPDVGEGRRNQNYGYILVSQADRDDYDNCSNYRPNGGGYNHKKIVPDEKKIRIGILRENTRHGFPAGCYIPYKLVQQSAIGLFENLTGNFILNDKYTKKV